MTDHGCRWKRVLEGLDMIYIFLLCAAIMYLASEINSGPKACASFSLFVIVSYIISCTLWLLQNTCSQRQVRGDLNCLVPVCHIILLFGVGLEIWMMTGLVLLLDEQCPVWSNSTADTVRFLILQGYIILSCMFRVLNVVFCAIVTLAPLTPVQHMIGEAPAHFPLAPARALSLTRSVSPETALSISEAKHVHDLEVDHLLIVRCRSHLCAQCSQDLNSAPLTTLLCRHAFHTHCLFQVRSSLSSAGLLVGWDHVAGWALIVWVGLDGDWLDWVWGSVGLLCLLYRRGRAPTPPIVPFVQSKLFSSLS